MKTEGATGLGRITRQRRQKQVKIDRATGLGRITRERTETGDDGRSKRSRQNNKRADRNR